MGTLARVNDASLPGLSLRVINNSSIEALAAVDPPATARLNLEADNLDSTVARNAGANILKGLGGNDVLAGGLGKDAFVFASKLNRTSNVDRISDFSVRDDTIRLENTIFKGLKAGTLKSDAFALGPKASDPSDRILYDKGSGALSFDRDGTGSAAAVKFAVLKKGLALTAADFFVI
jgi:Ca2+-binding RTX toxin-like protein